VTLELGHADVLVNDLDGQLVGNARLENEQPHRRRSALARTPSTW
jgi:hypothetical protein